MTEFKTFDKMNTVELKHAYDILAEAFKNGKYTPDEPGYAVMEKRLQNIEKEIRRKKPELLENIEEDNNILEKNYTIEQVGQIMNVTPQTIYNWVSEKLIPIIRIGKKTYISKIAIERLLKNGNLKKNSSE